jgi:hypothetical protein
VLNSAPRHEEVLREWRYISTYSLTSALDGCEWSASRSGRFNPRARAPGTDWIGGGGGWVGPRAGLNTVSKIKIPSPRRESKPDHPIVQRVASRYTDSNNYLFIIHDHITERLGSEVGMPASYSGRHVFCSLPTRGILAIIVYFYSLSRKYGVVPSNSENRFRPDPLKFFIHNYSSIWRYIA